MAGFGARWALALALLGLANGGSAAEPAAEALPAAPPAFYYPAPPRRSAYEVWQYYAVDRTGHFRARVAYTPGYSFYLYNGAPYPWTTTRPREFMPYILGD